MSISKYISEQDFQRREILSAIHEIIISADKNIDAEVGSMMGKEMILYKSDGIFKYGLSSMKEYMSLYLMPIYGSSPLHAKYVKLLPRARFQKGCINFKNREAVPLEIVKQLLADCAKVDLRAMMEKFKK